MATHAPTTGAPTRAPSIHAELRRFLRTHHVPYSRFGREALNDPAFVSDVLDNGRVPTPRIAARVFAYIASVEGR